MTAKVEDSAVNETAFFWLVSIAATEGSDSNVLLSDLNRQGSSVNHCKGRYMEGRRLIGIHRELTKALLLLLVCVFTWQHATRDNFAASAVPSGRNYQIREEFKLHNNPAPTSFDPAQLYLFEGFRKATLGRWHEAILAYRGAIAISPDYQEAYFAMGIAYSRLEYWEESLASFQKTVEISPDYAEAHFWIGMLLTKQGRKDQAVEAFKLAIKIEPRYVEAHFALALNYLMLGDRSSAMAEYEILKTLDPKLANELVPLIGR
jgi:tetratricopeptide (TPR) repeat protein